MHMRGYTLLEMIVAVGVFSVIMLAATGAYLTLINLDRQARATTDVVTNLSFAVDSMARSIRTGTDYECNNVPEQNCTGAQYGTSLGFTDSDGRDVVYSLSGEQLQVTIDPGAGGPVTTPLTDPRVAVSTLRFYVRGVGLGDGIQPQVTIVLRGTMLTGEGDEVEFSIQGGATQRFLEL